MGDDLDSNQFDFGDEFLNRTEKIVTDEDDIQDEFVAENIETLSKEKKKMKLKMLKQRIVDIKSVKDTEGKVCVSLKSKLTPINQLKSLIQALDIDDSFPLLIKEENFYDHEDEESKKTCPFFVAIRRGLRSFQSVLREKVDESGCPRIIIICPGATRATIVRNSLRKILKCKIAKLFAKHFKIHDQIELLKTHHAVVVGTPCRIHKLIELGALSLSHCLLILLDITKDKKKLNLLTISDIKRDLCDFILKDVNDEASHLQLAMVESAEAS